MGHRFEGRRATAACALARALGRVLVLGATLLAAGPGLDAPARAVDAEPFLMPIPSGERLPIGTAWSATQNRPLGDTGACVEASGTERHEGGTPVWSLLVLSRAGGRFVLGLHVSVPVATEGLRGAHLSDAARRLSRSAPASFAELCGDGFVAAEAYGGQYVAEIEVDPRDVARASALVETGTWTEAEAFQESVARWTGVVRSTARELPDALRENAVPLSTDEALRRAAAFPSTVKAETAPPYLALFHPYPASAVSGLEMDVDPTVGWGDVARQVFLHDPTRLAGSSAAARAAEMRKAVAHREATAASGPAGTSLSDEPPVPASAASGVASAPPGATEAADASAGAAPPAPAARAPAAAPPAAAPPGSVRVHRMAALVFAVSDEIPVYATTQAPPGVYAEKVRQRSYWVPGVAASTPEVHDALAAAAQSPPVRGTTILVAEVGSTAVVLTDAAPVAGVHAEPAGPLQAWIAGVHAPDPAQRHALEAAVRAAAP
jgi:hypothetical protein